MRTAIGVITGIAAGFTIAHFVNKTERGHAFFTQVNEQMDGFGEAVRAGYQARVEELEHVIAEHDQSSRRTR